MFIVKSPNVLKYGDVYGKCISVWRCVFVWTSTYKVINLVKDNTIEKDSSFSLMVVINAVFFRVYVSIHCNQFKG